MLKVIKGIVMAYCDYREKSKSVRELQAMTDKELADIGISRSMIRSVVYDYHR